MEEDNDSNFSESDHQIIDELNESLYKEPDSKSKNKVVVEGSPMLKAREITEPEEKEKQNIAKNSEKDETELEKTEEEIKQPREPINRVEDHSDGADDEVMAEPVEEPTITRKSEKQLEKERQQELDQARKQELEKEQALEKGLAHKVPDDAFEDPENKGFTYKYQELVIKYRIEAEEYKKQLEEMKRLQDLEKQQN